VGVSLADPLVGHLVDGRYEVTARIARGGMATVYRALDRRLDRHVAIKIMHPHLAEGSDVVARFRREARAAARLTHPGIVGVYDQGSDGETAYLTLEYVDGPNLRTLLRERGPLPLGDALDLVEAVLDALAAAHSAGLVHRDVKPENVLITPEGRVKVADFGLARAVTEATAATTGTVLGTVAYLSPEIVTAGLADARADVYACGVMLFELLTGEQPLTGETAIRTAYRHVHEDVPAPSTDVPWLPVEVDEVVAAMTARDVAERPHDARAALVLVRRAHLQIDDDTLRRRAPRPVHRAGAPAVRPSAAQEGFLELDALPTEAITGRVPSGTVAVPIGAVTDDDGLADEDRDRPVVSGRRRLAVRLLLLALVAALGSWWWLAAGPGAYTTVPEVAGRLSADAVDTLRAAGLGPVVREAHHDEVPEGRVVTTEPAPGAAVHKNGNVDVVVSLGVLMLEVPQTQGRSEQDAVQVLEDAGFTLAEVQRPYHMEVPKGSVISTEPAAGEIVPHNQPITLTVSNGREPVTIPSVVGATRATAEAELTERGLVPEVTTEYSEDVPKDAVIAQNPPPGTALRGDKVSLTVSLGPPLVEVPGVVGKQLAEAQRILRDAGFEVRVERVLGGFFGTVRAVSPSAGQQAPRGSVVTVTVV
jgi:beta-lactam-binding protein with PASTA domain/tRNA A-37 threonylcarbamoyl transferase component Bud32